MLQKVQQGTVEYMNEPANAPKPLTPGVVIPVAGVSFHQDVVKKVNIGDPVLIVHEQTNPYDVDSVIITTVNQEPLGHVPTKGNLNSRLLAGHRGGVWGGYVVDKLESKETTGLRVQVAKLLRHNEVGYGSDAAGVRQIDDTQAVEPVQHNVRTVGSGRHLGEYVSTANGRIRVRTPQGDIVSYPPAAVERY